MIQRTACYVRRVDECAGYVRGLADRSKLAISGTPAHHGERLSNRSLTMDAVDKSAKVMRAAAYVRMSTDHQDLSIGMQLDAIRDYSLINGIELVDVYEDAAKSGLRITNREGMKRLIRDVMEVPRPFDIVLVYDVSRWGRFQDIDAAAYYEYTCRLHGVSVVYVKESFGAKQDAMTALLKTIKRAMAAEYSRELGMKCRDGQDRAIRLGFQVGPLPPLGLTRVAVDRLGKRRLLGRKQPKGSQAERVAWVHGPQWEVDLVRRIFQMYAAEGGSLKSVARQLQYEGVLTGSGQRFTNDTVSLLLRNEAFIGNFVWGRAYRQKKNHQRETRADGVIEPIISRALWDTVQCKLQRCRFKRRTNDQLLEALRRQLEKNPLLSQVDLERTGMPSKETYNRAFGSLQAAMRLAGRDVGKVREHHLKQILVARAIGDLVQYDLVKLLVREGIECTPHTRSRVLILENGIRARVQLCWPHPSEAGNRWLLLKKSLPAGDLVIFAAMDLGPQAHWFGVSSMEEFRRLPPWVHQDPPSAVKALYTPEAIVRELKKQLARLNPSATDAGLPRERPLETQNCAAHP
jgi:DNA invertase Pin-like site-specific DNA recombinase